jgi:hypothetical protein
VSICKEGLRPLLRAARQRGGMGAAARLAQAVLSNLSRHPDNRSRMYRMELRVKEKVVRAAARKSANGGDMPSSSSEDDDSTSIAISMNVPPSVSVAGSAASSTSAGSRSGSKGGGYVVGAAGARAAIKVRNKFMRWMDQIDEEETAIGKGACHEQRLMGTVGAPLSMGSEQATELPDDPEQAAKVLRRRREERAGQPEWVDRLNKGVRRPPNGDGGRGGGGKGAGDDDDDSGDDNLGLEEEALRYDDDNLDMWGSCLIEDSITSNVGGDGTPPRWVPTTAANVPSNGGGGGGGGPGGGGKRSSLPALQGKMRAPLSSMWGSGTHAPPAAGAPDARYDPWNQEVLEFKDPPPRPRSTNHQKTGRNKRRGGAVQLLNSVDP